MNMIALIFLFMGLSSCNASPRASTKTSTQDFVKPDNEIWVMVIDTGIGKHEKLTNVQYNDSVDYKDDNGHGTHVAGIIQYGNQMFAGKNRLNLDDSLCKNVKIFSCKYFDARGFGDPIERSVKCITRATEMKMDYINYSGGGEVFSEEEYRAYKKYVNYGGTAIVAAGNERSSLGSRPYYPASYSENSGFTSRQRSTLNKDGSRSYVPIRIHVVQNYTRDGKLGNKSNTDPLATREVGTDILSTLPNNEYGYMTGTSQAAPAVLHTILKQECQRFLPK